ncbi:MAG: hypothetical protein HeimC3_32500 [Candidatus Heimdallarchaeota archaeon LC_3]|nr:MAG: hypothetical protein HeimC3_32500 [Candidatus Heimdallarchaeota archaeon LC_3]
MKIECLAINREMAEIAIKITENFKNDPRGPQYFFRDCLIAATVTKENLYLITNNLKDYPTITGKKATKLYKVNKF